MVAAVEVWAGVEVVPTEVLRVVTGRVEVSVFGRGGPVVVSGGDAAVVAVETLCSTPGVEAEVRVVLSVVGVGEAKEVEVDTRASVVAVKFRGGAAGVVGATPGVSESTVARVVPSFLLVVLQSVAANVGTGVVGGATWRVAAGGDSEVG